MLFVRLVRSSFAFGVIFFSYLVHLGLARVFGQIVRDEGAPKGPRRFETRKLPPWLEARRKRIDAKNARRLLNAMLRLRGVFIKLGQVLSIMGGFLPRVYTKELEQLQDQVPAQPVSQLEAALRASFGKGEGLVALVHGHRVRRLREDRSGHGPPLARVPQQGGGDDGATRVALPGDGESARRGACRRASPGGDGGSIPEPPELAC